MHVALETRPQSCAFGCVQVLGSKLLEQETRYRQLTQEQLDNFTLDMNTAYARLKGVEEAIDSKIHTWNNNQTVLLNDSSGLSAHMTVQPG